MSNWTKENRDAITLAQAKKAALADARKAGSWWIGKSRDEFQAEVRRRHACILNSRNPSDRSLGKVI